MLTNSARATSPSFYRQVPAAGPVRCSWPPRRRACSEERAAAYTAARRFRRSGGQSGLPLVGGARWTCRWSGLAIARLQSDDFGRRVRLSEPRPAWRLTV
jgi:hypothetical protein